MFDFINQLLGLKKKPEPKRPAPQAANQQPVRLAQPQQNPFARPASVLPVNQRQQVQRPAPRPAFNPLAEAGKFATNVNNATFGNALKAVRGVPEFVMKGQDGKNFGDNASDMVIGNTTRLVNTGNAGVVQPIVGLAQGKSPAQVGREMERDLYSSKGGLLNKGTIFPTKEVYKQTFKDPGSFAKGFTGAGVGVATEILPIARGASLLAKPGLTSTQKVVRGAGEGAIYGATGTAGQQMIQQRDLNAKEIALGAAIGAAAGGALPVAGATARNVSDSIPRTYNRGTTKGESPTWMTRNKKLAQEFADDKGGTVEHFKVKPKEVLDPRRIDHYKKLEKVVGEKKAEQLTSKTPSGAFDSSDERLLQTVSRKAGFKAAQVDERTIGRSANDTTLAKNPYSIVVNDPKFASSRRTSDPESGFLRLRSDTDTPEPSSKATISDPLATVEASPLLPVSSLPPSITPMMDVAPSPVRTRPRPATQTAPAPQPKELMIPPPSEVLTQTRQLPDLPPRGLTTNPDPLMKRTQFASRTIPESDSVSTGVKERIDAPIYNVNTERMAYQSSAKRLDTDGEERFISDSLSHLNKKNGTISRQEAADAQTSATILDVKGDPASLQRASQIYERLSEHYTAAGQLIQAAAIMSRRTPAGLKYQAEKTLREGDVKLTPQIQTQLKRLADATKNKVGADLDEAAHNLSKFVNDQVPVSFANKAINFWRAGLLTAPTTTGGNILGNSGEAVVRKGFVNPISQMADAAFSLKTGKRTIGQGNLGSFTRGAKEGSSKLGKFIKSGYDERNALSKYDSKEINYGNSPVGKLVSGYVNGTYRLMSVADQPFWYGARKDAIESIAGAEALNKGLKGSQKSTFIKEFVENPPEAALERATNEAKYATFQNTTALGQAASGLKKPLGAVGDFVVPFTQVPASIATRIVQRTPVGTAIEAVQQFVNIRKGGKFDQRAMSQAIAEGSFGPAVFAAGYALAGSGQLTFGFPEDKKERELWETEGKQPYSVRVGDRWYSLNYLQPFGTLLAIGGQAANEVKDGAEPGTVISQGIATAGQSVMNQSFLKGISGVLDAIDDPKRYAENYVANTAGSVVPNFIRSFARATDNTQREINGAVEGIKGSLPGLRQQLPEKLDMFGRPLPAKDNFLNQYVNPLRPSIARDVDTVTQEMRRLVDEDNGVLPTQATKDAFKSYGIKLTDEQVREINRMAGPALKTEYKKILDDPRYASLSNEDKAKALKRANDTVFGAVKAGYASAKGLIAADKMKLTDKQKQYSANSQSTALDENNKTSKSPAERFKANVEKYNEDKKAGKLTGPKAFEREKSLAKESITSKYSQDVLDFYKLSKADQDAYFEHDRSAATRLYDKSKELDNKLVEKGLATQKYKTSSRTRATKAAGGSGRVARSTSTRRTATGRVARARKVTTYKLPTAQLFKQTRSTAAIRKLLKNAKVA